MTKLFDIVPGWGWALIVAGLIATNVITSGRFQAEQLAHQTTRTEYAERVADAERARADEEASRRKIEQELTDAQAIHAQEVASISADLAASRAGGRIVSQRVRDAARTAAELASQVCSDSTTATIRSTAADAARVLADLRERADNRAGILAQFATDAHIAGRACEREYDSARKALKD